MQVVKQLMEGGYRHTARARQSRWYGWSQNACFTHRLAPPWFSKDATCKLRHQCTPSAFRLLPESALSPHTTRFAYVNHLVFCKSVASRSSVMIQAKQEGRARDRKCPSWPEPSACSKRMASSPGVGPQLSLLPICAPVYKCPPHQLETLCESTVLENSTVATSPSVV